jgi:hypothetical protein
MKYIPLSYIQVNNVTARPASILMFTNSRPYTTRSLATSDGTNFSIPDSPPVPNLPSFCRFGAFFNTSSQSRVQFELWLPVNGWNQRFAFVGNGGDVRVVANTYFYTIY